MTKTSGTDPSPSERQRKTADERNLYQTLESLRFRLERILLHSWKETLIDEKQSLVNFWSGDLEDIDVHGKTVDEKLSINDGLKIEPATILPSTFFWPTLALFNTCSHADIGLVSFVLIDRYRGTEFTYRSIYRCDQKGGGFSPSIWRMADPKNNMLQQWQERIINLSSNVVDPNYPTKKRHIDYILFFNREGYSENLGKTPLDFSGIVNDVECKQQILTRARLLEANVPGISEKIFENPKVFFPPELTSHRHDKKMLESIFLSCISNNRHIVSPVKRVGDLYVSCSENMPCADIKDERLRQQIGSMLGNYLVWILAVLGTPKTEKWPVIETFNIHHTFHPDNISKQPSQLVVYSKNVLLEDERIRFSYMFRSLLQPIEAAYATQALLNEEEIRIRNDSIYCIGHTLRHSIGALKLRVEENFPEVKTNATVRTGFEYLEGHTHFLEFAASPPIKNLFNENKEKFDRYFLSINDVQNRTSVDELIDACREQTRIKHPLYRQQIIHIDLQKIRDISNVHIAPFRDVDVDLDDQYCIRELLVRPIILELFRNVARHAKRQPRLKNDPCYISDKLDIVATVFIDVQQINDNGLTPDEEKSRLYLIVKNKIDKEKLKQRNDDPNKRKNALWFCYPENEYPERDQWVPWPELRNSGPGTAITSLKLKGLAHMLYKFSSNKIGNETEDFVEIAINFNRIMEC